MDTAGKREQNDGAVPATKEGNRSDILRAVGADQARAETPASGAPAEPDPTDAQLRIGDFPSTSHTKELLDEYLELLNSWNWKVNVVRATQIVLTVTAVVASTLVTITASQSGLSTLRLWASGVAAVTVGLLYGSGIGAKADRWRDGWRRLSLAWSLRAAEKISDADLILARHGAEKLIGGVVIQIGRSDVKA